MSDRLPPQHAHHAQTSRRKGLHKDWRAWVALIAMLGAISAYVLTLDDSDADVAPAPASAAP